MSAGARRPGSLADNLFPLAPPSRTHSALCIVGYLVGFVAVTATSLLRQSGLAATQTVWAEDGNVFYLQAVHSSFWHTLWTPYNGYAQLVPRLLAQVAAHGPPAGASRAMAVAGALTIAAVVCAVFHMSAGLVPQVPLRLGLAAGIVLLPIAPAELLDNVVNTTWWLFFAGFWAVLWRPLSPWGRAGAAVVAFLAVASDPLAALSLGVAGLRWAALRRSPGHSWRDHTAALGIFAALAYQLLARIGGAPAAPSMPTTAGLWNTMLVRLGLGLVAGARGTNWVIAQSHGVAIALGAAVLVVILCLGLAIRQVRDFTLVAVGYALVSFILPVWARGVSTVMGFSPVSTGARYSAVPLLVLTSALFVIASHFPAPQSHRRPVNFFGLRAPRRALSGLVVLALLAPWWLADFRDANARTAGPDWPAQIKAAVPACRAHPENQFKVDIDPPPWFTDLPCHAVLP